MTAPGRFISFEGVDGSGKSTQAALLANALEARGLTVVRTREPGGTALGEALRGVLLESAPGSIGPVAEVHLFAAARAQLVAEVIAPTLAAGGWVIADRFVDSSLAYQGVGRGLGIPTVLELNELALAGHRPNLTLVLQLEPAAAAERRREGAADRIESEGAALQRRVAAGYAELLERFPVHLRAIDAAGPPEAVHGRVWDAVAALPGVAL